MAVSPPLLEFWTLSIFYTCFYLFSFNFFVQVGQIKIWGCIFIVIRKKQLMTKGLFKRSDYRRTHIFYFLESLSYLYTLLMMQRDPCFITILDP